MKDIPKQAIHKVEIFQNCVRSRLRSDPRERTNVGSAANGSRIVNVTLSPYLSHSDLR